MEEQEDEASAATEMEMEMEMGTLQRHPRRRTLSGSL